MSTRDELRQSVVLVHGELLGTGFFIGNDGSLLTCFHVVGDKQTREITHQELEVTFSGQNYHARCIYSSPNPQTLDFAILRLTDNKLPSGAVLLPLGEWKSSLSEPHEFITFGFRSLEDFKGLFAEGRIIGQVSKRDPHKELLQLSSGQIGQEEIRHGMSGAPVYHEATDRIVGMISSRFEERPVKAKGQAEEQAEGQAEDQAKVIEIIPLAVPIEQIAKVSFLVERRLRDERILEELSSVFRVEGWFTEKALEEFYERLCGRLMDWSWRNMTD